MAVPGLEKRATPEELRRILRNPAFDHMELCVFGSWRVYLHEDQRYLGRSYAWWRGTGHIDLMDLSDLTQVGSDRFVFRGDSALQSGSKRHVGCDAH